MKKFLLLMVCVAVGVLFASSAMANTLTYTAGDGVNGSPHDLSQAGGGMASYNANPADSLNRICIFCHAPHNTYKLSVANGGPGVGVGAGPDAGDQFTYLPLWNHTLTSQTFTMYQNGPGAPDGAVTPHGSQAITNGMTPGSTSLLCLGCHDGSVAPNSYGNTAQLTRSQSDLANTGPTIGSFAGSEPYQIGKDGYLGNHHPIGFDYVDVQTGASTGFADTEIRDAAATPMGAAGTIQDHLYGPGSTIMECGTCHSVHNKGNTGETLLWRSDTNSRLCLTCHDKGTDPAAVTP